MHLRIVNGKYSELEKCSDFDEKLFLTKEIRLNLLLQKDRRVSVVFTIHHLQMNLLCLLLQSYLQLPPPHQCHTFLSKPAEQLVEPQLSLPQWHHQGFLRHRIHSQLHILP